MNPNKALWEKDGFTGIAALFLDAFRRFFGPTMNAFEAAQTGGAAGEPHRQLLELAHEHDSSTTRARRAVSRSRPRSCA